MVSYTLPQNPDTIITVRGKDSERARQKAMDKLVEMMDSGEIPIELENGFGPEQFIEAKESKELKEPKELKELKESRESKKAKDSKELKELR